MKKLLSIVFAFMVALTALPAHAADFTAQQMKKMSIFLSNFTELGFLAFDAEEFVRDEGAVVSFGVWHNYINNKANISDCSQCQWGDRAIHQIHIKEAMKRYFDYDIKTFPQVEEDGYPFHYTGSRYQFDKINYLKWIHAYATVLKARQTADGKIEMTGQYYLPDEHNRIIGKFKALAKPHTWNGKDTWAIIRLEYTSSDDCGCAG